ncbi:unnamed protein product [Scytosiphon promiscuus]
MDEVWAKGRRDVQISKLYLRGLLKRGPNIFVALAWSQAFWLTLEATAGNENSHGYVRLSSVASYALALHTGGHLLLYRYSGGGGGRKLSHHALEFLLDLVTDVVGFAWINVAEEMLAQVFQVRAKTTFMYAALAFVASLGAMQIGSLVRSLLDWPVEFEETANGFDAGSFALPTSWLITQGVHIGLYGFFYRSWTGGGQGGGRMSGDGDGDDDVVDVRLAASLFLLAYALLCSMLATKAIGGTVAASAVTGSGGGGGPDGIEAGSLGVDPGDGNYDGGGNVNSSDLVFRVISSYEINAAQASDAAAEAPPAAPPRGGRGAPVPGRGGGGGGSGRSSTRRNTPGSERDGVGVEGDDSSGENRDEEGEGGGGDVGEPGAAPLTPGALVAAAVAAAAAGQARQESLRRGLKAYMRLTVAMMVGWAYNLWGQVEFRQEDLEFRFGPALGATVYAILSTALGCCIMVRGANKLDRKSRSDGDGGGGGGPGEGVGSGRRSGAGTRVSGDERAKAEAAEAAQATERRHREAVRSYHARRLMVVVGGVSLVVGWAWEEAFDLMLEGLVGDEADVGTVLAKVALAVVATAVVLGREIRQGNHHHGHDRGEGGRTVDGHELGEVDGGGGELLLEPLLATSSAAAPTT